MNKVPIVFAFDNNLTMPAAVCIFSLLANAKDDTHYDIYVLKRQGEDLDLSYADKVLDQFPKHSLTIREVGDTFDSSFEIRGITTPAYYRLLIPSLIPEYDKVLYSDVDVIFRDDLSHIYNTDIEDNYIGGVNAIVFLDVDLNDYYNKLGLDTRSIVYSGNLIFNNKAIRENPELGINFTTLAKNDYKFQDMDILNIACEGKIYQLQPEFCLTTYIYRSMVSNEKELSNVWTSAEMDYARTHGLIHYNGQKPWKGFCVNFDIWWEYYRKSPIYDEKFYFDFFYNKLDEYDRLSLIKRIKILARYFVYGRKN